jgi:hypothetical protein
LWEARRLDFVIRARPLTASSTFKSQFIVKLKINTTSGDRKDRIRFRESLQYIVALIATKAIVLG